MKQNNKIQNVLALVLTIVALMVGQTAWATEYITDVMLIGAYERSDYNTLVAKYTAEGWKQTNWDQNHGISWGDGDAILLLYKTAESTDGFNHDYITDFYIQNSNAANTTETLDFMGRTYNLVPISDDSDDYFKEQKGDLNSHTGDSVKDAEDQDVSVAESSGVYSFTMPASNVAVTVSASFIAKDFTNDGHLGTYEDPYIIYNKDQLVLMASMTGDNWKSYSGKFFTLANDIDMSGVTDYNGSFVFKGHFDGNNKTISNLTINSSSNQVGLFGFIENGSVENLTLSGATITGNDYVGGIAGWSTSSTIRNCKVIGSTITVNQENLPCVGAIVGFNNGGTLTSNTYHSTLVCAPNYQGTYYKAGGTAFHIGVGYDEVFSNPYGDVSGAVLDATKLFLADNRDNTALIAAYADPANHTTYGGTVPSFTSGINVTLKDRTLWKDGAWNTLCLPFAVSTTSAPLSGDGVQAMTLDADNSGLSGSTLTLNFTAAETIPAGTPFIIKWDNTGNHLTEKDLVFYTNITYTPIPGSTEVSFTGGKFKGTYNPMTFTDENKSILFLGYDAEDTEHHSKLYYPESGASIKAFRSYFQLNDGAGVKAFNLRFGGDETTNIGEIPTFRDVDMSKGAWSDLSGRRLTTRPTRKGFYIHRGQKTAIK